jgi:molybdopterin-containing oxidoreductase family iron-sulfur binding subunit
MQNNTRPGVVWNKIDRVEWGEYPQAGRTYLPHACMQCDAPACVAACPTGASYKRADGITLVDYDKCICCEQCAVACPYDARRVDNTQEYWFEQNVPAPYESYGVQRSDVVEKCIFCAELVDGGGQPACVSNCPGGARTFGDIDDPESPVALKAANAVRVDSTGFYYLPVAGMQEELIFDHVLAPQPEPRHGRKAEASPTPLIVGAGVAAAGAVGIAAGVLARGRRTSPKAAAGASAEQSIAAEAPEKQSNGSEDNDDKAVS